MQEQIYQLLTGEDGVERVCRDIPEEACNDQPSNFLIHVLSLSATKTGDGLLDPKLVLAWVLTSLGAPAIFIGLLVPVREAGALLPQLFTAAAIRAQPIRKWIWSVGSLIQGVCVAGISLSALLLTGQVAGWVIIILLAIFAVARSACSVSYKDVLGKTVSKATRGTATGTASTIAAAAILLFGILLSFGIIEKSIITIAAALFIAAGLWVFSATIFGLLSEHRGATEGGGNALFVAIAQIGLLKGDPQLVRFITTRSLLTATALAPPYIVAVAGEQAGGDLGQLGPFVIASGLAAVLSTYIWGRLSDKSSRKVLILSASLGLVALIAAGAIGMIPVLARSFYALPTVLFVLMIGYQGVRIGRATHVVDMATPETRAAYTALSNTIIGLVLIAGGVFGFVAEYGGEVLVLALFAAMCLLALLSARGLKEVQAED